MLPRIASILTLTCLVAPAAGQLPAAAETTFTSRMSASYGALVDESGTTWSARSASLGTAAISRSLVGTDIAGTTLDSVYQLNAHGLTGYRLDVPASGYYRVRLLMAEDWFTKAGQRVFDVSAEGSPSLSGVDIAGSVGKAAAYDRTFTVQVTDGTLDLGFTAVKDKPLVSAIEVVAVPPPPPPPAPTPTEPPAEASTPPATAPTYVHRAGAAYERFTDGDGNLWGARPSTFGDKLTSIANTVDIAGTTRDEVFRTLAPGARGLDVSVPDGTYSVTVLAAEDYFTGAGQRVFDVTAEGKTALAGVDIAAAVGRRAAYEKTFDVQVDDGVLNLGFVAKVDQPVIAAVQVLGYNATTAASVPAVTPPPAQHYFRRMTVQNKTVADGAGREWEPQFGFDGQIAGGTMSGDIAGTTDYELYRTNMVGMKRWAAVVPGKGSYTVTLHMIDDWFTKAGQRVFNVTAEGGTVLSGIDVAGTVGKGAAYQRTFTVDVTDGTLDLGWVNVKDMGIVTAIEVTGNQPYGGPGPFSAGRIVDFAPSSYWYSSVRHAPVADNSAAQTEELVKQVSGAYYGIAAFNTSHFNVSYVTATASTPRTDVTWWDCQGRGYLPANLTTGAAYFKNVPIPADAVQANGTDGHLAVYDPVTDKLWEFWQASKTSTGWRACWGGRIDDVRLNNGNFAVGYGVDATNTSAVPGMVTQEDIHRGYINHAMSLQLIETAPWTQISWPATSSDGDPKSTSLIREGNRLRLDPNLDVDRLNLTPIGKMVARAAQEYGFLVDNRSSAVSIPAEAGLIAAKRTGVDPWTGLLGGVADHDQLRGFPWDKMQFMPVDYGKP